MNIDFSAFSPEETEQLAMLIVARLEGSLKNRGDAENRLAPDGAVREGDSADTADSAKQFSQQDRELFRELVTTVKLYGEKLESASALTTTHESDKARIATASEAERPGIYRSFERQMSVPGGEKSSSGNNNYETNASGTPEMENISRFFGRDIRRYDSAFQRF